MVPTAALVLPLVLAPALAAQGRIQLPPPKPEKQEKATAPSRPRQQEAEYARFRKRLLELKRARRGAETTFESIGREFLDLPALMLRGVRTAEGAELESLLRVARRYGTVPFGRELALQLRLRPFGRSAHDAVDVVTRLLGGDAVPALFELAHGRYANVRSAAVAELEERVGPDHLQQVISFTRSRSLDDRRNGVRLLAVIDAEPARRRLVEMLSADRSRDLTISAEACKALIAHGRAAVPVLREVCEGPVIDQSYGYAAFALARIGASGDESLLEPQWASKLQVALEGTDPLHRSLAAVALAERIWRSDDDLEEGLENGVVAQLLEIVAPRGYIANLDLLQTPAESALERLSGREAFASRTQWWTWWESAQDGFVAMRRTLELDAGGVENAVVRLSDRGRVVKLMGAGLAGNVDAGDEEREILLTADQMKALFEDLEERGLMVSRPPRRSPLPTVRSLEVRLGNGGYRVGATVEETPWFDLLAQRVREEVDRQLWQLYRHPTDEPDPAAFWRAERRWLAEHEEPEARRARLLRRILRVWPVLDEERRTVALEHMLSIPDVRTLIDDETGARMIALVEGREVGEVGLGLLELALAAPGDEVWRRVLDVVDRALAEGGDDGDDALSGDALVARLFGLLGPDRVLAALEDERLRVRLAAAEEVVESRDRRAGEVLLGWLDSDEAEEVRMAVFALGRLRTAEAREPLMELVVAEDTPPSLRQAGMVALGRIGGPGVVALLRSALPSPLYADKEAAVRGLGALRKPEASKVLARLFASHHGDRLGRLTSLEFRRQGALLAAPALREELARAADAATRRALVLELGRFEDPSVVDELIAMLDAHGPEALRVVALLENTTGVALAGRNDRIGFMQRWYASHRRDPQAVWFLNALEAPDVRMSTGLAPEQVVPEAGMAAVPELTRLLVQLRQPRLRVLCAAVLRTLTGTEFGRVTGSTNRKTLEQIATRYRYFAEASRAASGR